jgi:hypothetical protein
MLRPKATTEGLNQAIQDVQLISYHVRIEMDSEKWQCAQILKSLVNEKWVW